LTADAHNLVVSVGTKDADLVLYDISTRARVQTYQVIRPIGVPVGVACMALSPDGRRIFSNGYDRVGRLWDRESGKELHRCKGAFVAEEAAFSPDGRLVLAGAYLFDVSSGKLLHCFEEDAPGVYGAAFSPDGRRALAGCTDHTVRLWDVSTGREINCFKGHTEYVRGVAFSPLGSEAFSCSWDGTMRMWKLPD
jgi:WD40 repeat protein